MAAKLENDNVDQDQTRTRVRNRCPEHVGRICWDLVCLQKLFYLQRDRVKAGRMLVTEWEVVISLESAKALGLDVSPSIQVRADEVPHPLLRPRRPGRARPRHQSRQAGGQPDRNQFF